MHDRASLIMVARVITTSRLAHPTFRRQGRFYVLAIYDVGMDFSFQFTLTFDQVLLSGAANSSKLTFLSSPAPSRMLYVPSSIAPHYAIANGARETYGTQICT